MSIAHQRRLIQKKMAAIVYRPMTENDLLKKYDADYVKLLKDDAIKRKRVSKDKLAPTDPLRTRSPICFIFNHAFKNKTLFSVTCQTLLLVKNRMYLSFKNALLVFKTKTLFIHKTRQCFYSRTMQCSYPEDNTLLFMQTTQSRTLCIFTQHVFRTMALL